MSKRPVEEFTGANSFLPMTNKKFRNEGDPGNSRANDGGFPFQAYMGPGNSKAQMSGNVMADSRQQARNCFKWLIKPFDVDQFFRHHWEKEPLLVQHRGHDYFSGVFSTADFDRILRERQLQFNKNIDITSFVHEKRKTFKADGRAYPAVVWDQYMQGCSIRLLNPQTFSRSVWKLNSILQEFFGTFVGANVYLTPPGTQGFAPHYDDIEAFVLQLEGRKQWRVYPPMDEKSTLPRFSSKNFRHDEITSNPIMSAELEPGDLLYFPRGFIHEARAVDDTHSLHITISAAQKNTFGDLLELVLPQALEKAMENERDFKESLPHNYLDYMGIVHRNDVHADRESFRDRLRSLLVKLAEFVDADEAADKMGKKFMHQALPPVLTTAEKETSIHGAGEHWSAESNTVEDSVDIALETQIRLMRYGVARLAKDEGQYRLYHCMENSYDPHQDVDPQYIVIEEHLVPAVKRIIKSYPYPLTVVELPVPSQDDKLDIANLLFDKGIIHVIPNDSVLE